VISVKLKASAAVVAAAGLFTGLSATEAVADPNVTRTYSVRGIHELNGYHSGYSDGYGYFYNRSVGITGTVKSDTTGCVQVEFQVVSHGFTTDWQTRTACGRGPGSSKGFNFTSPADYPGGAAYVTVRLFGINSDGSRVELDTTYMSVE
jgi:hypothetical protein